MGLEDTLEYKFWAWRVRELAYTTHTRKIAAQYQLALANLVGWASR